MTHVYSLVAQFYFSFLQISTIMLGLTEAQENVKIATDLGKFVYLKKNSVFHFYHIYSHGLRTPNEGINQRYLKNWADGADEICFACI